MAVVHPANRCRFISNITRSLCLCRFFLKFFLKCNQNCLKNAGNPRDMRRFQVKKKTLFLCFLAIIMLENTQLHRKRAGMKAKRTEKSCDFDLGLCGLYYFLIFSAPTQSGRHHFSLSGDTGWPTDIDRFITKVHVC